MSEEISCNEFLSGGPVEKVPMHPEDFAALLAWVMAKEERERKNPWQGNRYSGGSCPVERTTLRKKCNSV